jgi:translation initiation factor 2 alpha subunit (eIF-2alpha)
MIAPPHYKCETITLEKAKGLEKLEEALKIVEKVIREKEGTFKLVSKPQVIGAKDEKDIDDLIANINDDREEGSSG